MSQRAKQILVVDSSRDILEGIADLVSTFGHTVLTATDGSLAQEIIAKEPELSLLITELRMPNVDGAELLAWCRENGHHFPIILMSAEPHLLRREKAALCDCCAFLIYKPFDVDMFANFINTAQRVDHDVHCEVN